MVFSGLTAAWRRASVPTTCSPDFVKATTEGVVREPSELGMTTGSPPSMTAMTELVVPKSIPTVFGMGQLSSKLVFCRWGGFDSKVNTLIFFPASAEAKPRRPLVLTDGDLRARPCRPHRHRGRGRAGPAPLLSPGHRLRADADPRLRKRADPGAGGAPPPDAGSSADRKPRARRLGRGFDRPCPWRARVADRRDGARLPRGPQDVRAGREPGRSRRGGRSAAGRRRAQRSLLAQPRSG